MRHNIRGLVAAFVLMVGFIALWPARAMAYDCDSVVVDQADALGSGLSKVQAAAQELVDNGATVRVRTTNDIGSAASTNDYVTGLISQCPSWQAQGGMKNSLIVLVAKYDGSGNARGDALRYGSQWSTQLDAQWKGIESEDLKPRLKDGDSVGGLVTALNSVNDIVEANKIARTSSVGTSTSRSSAPAPVVVTRPTDYTGLWHVLEGLLVLGLIGGIVVGLVVRNNRKQHREALQKSARATKQSAVTRLNGMDMPLTLISSRVGSVARNLSESDAQPLRDQLARVQALLATARGNFDAYESSATDPEGEHPAETYQDIDARYGELDQSLSAIETARGALETEVTRVERLAQEVPAAIAEATAKLGMADEAIAAATSKGFKTAAAQAKADEAGTNLETATTALGAKRFGDAKTAADAAVLRSEEAVQLANGLAARKSAVDTAVARLTAAAGDAERLIGSTRTTYDAIVASYAPACYEVVRGNGTQANARLTAARAAIAAATTAGSMAAQDWDAADAKIGEADGAIASVTSLMRSISELSRNLEAAKREAPNEIALAQKDIEAVRRYEAENDADIDDGIKKQIAAAQLALDGAKDELAKAQPDYLEVVKIAKRANAAADKILDTARGEVDAANRLRQRAATAMREAERSVSAAREYIDDHRSDVDSDAERRLETARSAYAQARSARNINDQIRYADEADAESDSALEMARRDVRRENDRRDDERRAAEAAALALIEAARPRHHHHHRQDDNNGGGFSLPSFDSTPSGPSGGGSDWGNSSPSGGGGGSDWSSNAPSGGGGGGSDW